MKNLTKFMAELHRVLPNKNHSIAFNDGELVLSVHYKGFCEVCELAVTKVKNV